MRLAQSVDRDFTVFWIASASQVPTSYITHFFHDTPVRASQLALCTATTSNLRQ